MPSPVLMKKFTRRTLVTAAACSASALVLAKRASANPPLVAAQTREVLNGISGLAVDFASDLQPSFSDHGITVPGMTALMESEVRKSGLKLLTVKGRGTSPVLIARLAASPVPDTELTVYSLVLDLGDTVELLRQPKRTVAGASTYSRSYVGALNANSFAAFAGQFQAAVGSMVAEITQANLLK